MKVVDFFCGGGGFSEGFRQAGFDIVFAVDKWEPAIITYKGNKPGVNVVLDDVIRISNLPDDQFEALVPDSEVIIGSPPCQSFSHSNKSGNADKSIGIKLIKAYLKIIARKKYKKNSILKYWVLENVPSVKEYIEDEYTAEDLGLEGSFVLRPHGGNSGKYNAKYYGAPTNRQRYLCGEFPPLQRTNEDNNVKTLGDVLKTLGDPLSPIPNEVTDLNYPTLVLPKSQVTDHQYIYELAPFEWKTAELKKRLKSDELAGEKAELFVVKYEKKRLGVEGENKVKRISEIDVTAGYDIVSANSPNSTVANRFIEVKAVSENGFYWSKNEYDIAKLLAADYYLYLVDLSKIDDDNYEPDIIHNPVQHIMENNLWLVEPQSYHIQKVKF